MTRQDQLEQWARSAPSEAVVMHVATQTTLGWSAEMVDTALAALRRREPFYMDSERWVNPWARVGPETIAAQLFPQGYLSGEWALAWHGCLSQQPTRLMIVDATHPAASPQVLAGVWSIECLPPLFEEPPELVYPPDSLPIADAARALVEWTVYRWQSRQGSRDELANFLDDCDRDVVDATLQRLVNDSPSASIRQLAQTILETWPDDSRWPSSSQTL